MSASDELIANLKVLDATTREINTLQSALAGVMFRRLRRITQTTSSKPKIEEVTKKEAVIKPLYFSDLDLKDTNIFNIKSDGFAGESVEEVASIQQLKIPKIVELENNKIENFRSRLFNFSKKFASKFNELLPNKLIKFLKRTKDKLSFLKIF